MKTLIVIPARKGSSFKGKNLLPVNGIPMLELAIDCATDNGDVIVSTDDPWAEALAVKKGIEVVKRPAELAINLATLDSVMVYMAKLKPDYVYYVCLQPCSPRRTNQHLKEALDRIEQYDGDSLVSVCSELKSIWRIDGKFAEPIVERTVNRQVANPVYVANGAIFITKGSALMRHQRRAVGRVVLYEMDWKDSIDVHNEFDIRLAEWLSSGMKS